MSASADKVLIVTGGLLSPSDRSLRAVIARQVAAFRGSSGPWLDVQSKLAVLEPVVAAQLERRTRRYRRAAHRATVDAYFAHPTSFETPELTEVALMTLLDREGLRFEATTWAELDADPARRERLLTECRCVFASTTLLRDRGELAAMVALVARPDNRVVVGGALVAMLAAGWEGCEGVDVVAVGYGELLVPALAAWIRGGYAHLEPPPGGRIERRAGIPLVHSGLPAGRDLDWLPAPDWALAGRYHGRSFPMVSYESARGCPYRCAFCNYPRLFDDATFRTRSAARIADDWERYALEGARIVTCLDSLFTMPRRRLVELCRLLVERELDLRWICYARADDLADRETCDLMRRAGCMQVQIGLESGSQRILDNMRKRATVEQSRRALRNCRQAGLVTVTTVMVGFPGETPETIEESHRLLTEAPPDVFWAAAFNTRFEQAPILDHAEAARFGLVTLRGGCSPIPYWRHDTMSSSEVCGHTRHLSRRLALEGVALDGAIFYGGLLGYEPAQRADLLAFQRDAYAHHAALRAAFRGLDRWAHRHVVRDIERLFGPPS